MHTLPRTVRWRHLAGRLICSGIMEVWLLMLHVLVAGENVLTNSSFEQGGFGLTGWTARSGCSVGTSQPHRGQRYAIGMARNWIRAWESEPASVCAQTDYRLEAWMRGPEGAGRLD